MTITPEDLVRREVHYCVSELVSTLTAGAYADHGPPYMHTGETAGRHLDDLCDQALELAAPIDDWEEAAIQAGWSLSKDPFGKPAFIATSEPDAGLISAAVPPDWADLCQRENLEPYQREVFEHWIVSDWLADKLEAEGEKVDRDFAGLTVWARTTTGQAIYADGVIKRICTALNVA